MPGEILSDADIFGQAPPAAQAAPAATPQTLSHDDVFGPGPIAKPPRSDASIAIGGAKAGARAVARSVADFGDMFLSIPGMAAGTLADMGSRVQSLFEGESSAAGGRIAKSVREGITEKFSPPILRSLTEMAIQAISPDKKAYDQSDVQKGMATIAEGIEKGGKWVEKKTNGIITAETFDSLVNEGMALGGVKGVQAGAKGVGGRLAARTERKAGPLAAPEAPAQPDTPAQAAAKRDVKAEAEAATGVNPLRGKAAKEARDARREQARDAFKEDPEYADYLRNVAEEEAKVREAGSPAMTAPGGLPGSGLRARRTGSVEGVPLEKELPPSSTPSVETGAKGSLDSALEKLRAGKGFDLTTEERIAVKGIASQYGRPEILDSRGKPIQKGGADPDLLKLIAGVGLGTGLAIYASNHQDQALMALGGLGAMTEARSALSTALRDTNYTVKTLERLPQNRTEFTREQVEQQLNRPDVSKAEKELVLGVLGDKKTVSAVELVQGFKKAAGPLELKTKETDQYADYGVENLGRYTEMSRDVDEWGSASAEERNTAESQEVTARTTLYRSPGLDNTNNHFDDPQYFAHTRSFDEDGVRHVVEIQSDVAQHAKALTTEEREAAESALRKAEREYVSAVTARDAVLPPSGSMAERAPLQEQVNRTAQRMAEARAALGTDVRAVQPLLKNWFKRIVREELGRVPGEPVRFATADTVAKVEGWPRELRDGVGPEEDLVSPEHQSIYDRYRGDIEKFLRTELDAKPHTDSEGHTWLEVPASKNHRGRTQMFGRADVGALAGLAAFIGGAAAMQAWSDNPSLVKDVVVGATAAAATRIRPKAVAQLVREARNAKPLESIGAAAIERAGNLQLAGNDIANTVWKIGKLVPSAESRSKVHTALDEGSTKGLTPKELEAYTILKGEYARLLKVGREAGVLKDAVADYATHILKADRGLFDRVMGTETTYGTSPHTPYELERKFRTIAEGEATGLQYQKDAAFVFATYARSIASAAENAKLLATIKEQKTAAGEKLVVKGSDAPRSYIHIDNPQLRNLSVHPEVASQMKFIFENPSSSGISVLLETIADVSKRSAVAASLFHTKALIDSLVGSVPATPKDFGRAAIAGAAGYTAANLLGDDHAGREAALAALAGYVGPRAGYLIGRGKFLDELRKGSGSELIKRATKSGLTFGVEKGPLVVDDAGRRFYDAMKWVQEQADKLTAPVGIKGGKPIEAYIKANHMMDEALWGRMHPGLKLEVWNKTSGILRESSVARNARDPKTRILSEAEADSIAADFANDQFGGLNWTKIAMGAETRIGRMVAQSLLSPKGRQVMRIAMFAPDWTISTARAALAAVDKDLVNPLKWGNVAKGMFQPMTRGDLARQYIARSALYYLVIGDAINYSMSNHHLWENKDWSFIDWGDGRRMQFSKHVMEVPHWFDHPVKQGVGKLGYVPKEIANQALGTEYLAPQAGKQGQVFAGPKMRDSSPLGRIEHAAQGFIPIPFQSAQDAETFGWGFAGMPLYGKTREQTEELRRKRREEKWKVSR